MPRPRSPERDQSYAIYEQHNGEIENRRIADMVGKDERFIAKWKHEDAWVDKLKKNKGVHHSPNAVHLKDERCTPNPAENIPTNNISENPLGETAAQPPTEGKTKTTQPSRGGAPKGNKNAVGNNGGAPPGNKNAVTTGEYETIDPNSITDDEESALLDEPLDEQAELEQLIKAERIRRHRINKRIQAAENAPGGMVIDGVIKTKGRTIVHGFEDSTQTSANAGVNRADKFENSLTRVINGTRQSLGLLHRIKTERAKVESDTKDDLLDDWFAGDDWDD